MFSVRIWQPTATAMPNLTYILKKWLPSGGPACLMLLRKSCWHQLGSWKLCLAVLNTQESTSAVCVGPRNMERFWQLRQLKAQKICAEPMSFQMWFQKFCWSMLLKFPVKFYGMRGSKKCSWHHTAPSHWMASDIGLLGCKAQRTLSTMWLQTLTLTFFTTTHLEPLSCQHVRPLCGRIICEGIKVGIPMRFRF